MFCNRIKILFLFFLCRFIIVQLFEIAALYDYSDETGRTNLMNLIAEVLVMNNKVMYKELMEVCIGMLERLVPNIEVRQQLVVGMINELRSPSKPTQASQVAPLLSEHELHEFRLQVWIFKN